MLRLRPLLAALAPAAVALWIGAVVAIAFVAAPLVFAGVPEYIASKDAAGRVIGPAFGRVDTGGIVAGLLGLLHLALLPRGPGLLWRRLLLGAMVLAAAVDLVWIAPAITARTEPLRTYHAIATGIWMLILLGGLTLMLRGLTPSPDHS